MAEITRKQAKARAQKIADLLDQVRDLLETLQMETQEEADSIEPYENRDELTEQQEERAEWLQDAADCLEEQTDQVAEIIAELEDRIIFN